MRRVTLVPVRTGQTVQTGATLWRLGTPEGTGRMRPMQGQGPGLFRRKLAAACQGRHPVRESVRPRSQAAGQGASHPGPSSHESPRAAPPGFFPKRPWRVHRARCPQSTPPSRKKTKTGYKRSHGHDSQAHLQDCVGQTHVFHDIRFGNHCNKIRHLPASHPAFTGQRQVPRRLCYDASRDGHRSKRPGAASQESVAYLPCPIPLWPQDQAFPMAGSRAILIQRTTRHLSGVRSRNFATNPTVWPP